MGEAKVNQNNNLEWYKNLRKSERYAVEATKIAFASAIEQKLSIQGMNKKSLADGMGTSAAYITQVLRGDANLTIESMVKLARAANCDLHIHLSHKASTVRWIEGINSGDRSKEQSAAFAWACHALSGEKYERTAVSA